MNPSRVFILASQPLFAQGVRSLISGRTGFDIVGVATVGLEGIAKVEAAAPDVVIVEANAEGQAQLVAKVLDSVPGVRVVGLSPEDNRIHTYYQQMRQGRRVEDLLEAIGGPFDWRVQGPGTLQLFVLFQGHYGQRILENIRRFAPKTWTVAAWRAPAHLPQVVDDPLAFLPTHLPAADLVLSLGEDAGVAQLLPSVSERTGARSVIAPVDNVAWLPDGLVRQLGIWLAEMGVATAFPKPFCSLTEHGYGVPGHEVSLDNPAIREFAQHFGRPVFGVTCDAAGPGGQARIARVEMRRDAACGCARSVARQLIGVEVRDAIVQTGLFHHHYPCLATMRVDPNLGQPLIQASGSYMRQAVESEIAAHLRQAEDLQPGVVERAP
jgi:hypothetical protein